MWPFSALPRSNMAPPGSLMSWFRRGLVTLFFPSDWARPSLGAATLLPLLVVQGETLELAGRRLYQMAPFATAVPPFPLGVPVPHLGLSPASAVFGPRPLRLPPAVRGWRGRTTLRQSSPVPRGRESRSPPVAVRRGAAHSDVAVVGVSPHSAIGARHLPLHTR